MKSALEDKKFSFLKKCRSKFDCLIFEMLSIKELIPVLNTQKKDSIHAQPFLLYSMRTNALYLYTLVFFRPFNQSFKIVVFFAFVSLRNSQFIFVICNHFIHSVDLI